MSTNESILVLGTGELGTEVLRSLASHAHRNSRPVTVLLRSYPPDVEATQKRKNQLAAFKALHISSVEASMVEDSQSVLERIFDRYHTIIGCSGMNYPPGTQLKITRAVLASSARRYLPWQFGVDYDVIGRGSSKDLFSEQLDVRDLLRGQSKLDWVIISTGLFMSFLFEPTFGVVDRDWTAVTALGAWDTRVTVTSVQDMARVLAKVVWLAPEVKGVIYTAGATVSYRDVADAVAGMQQNRGTTIRRELTTIDQLKKELESDPDNGLKKYRVVFAEGKGVAWNEAQTFNSRRGMEMCGMQHWLSKKP